LPKYATDKIRSDEVSFDSDGWKYEGKETLMNYVKPQVVDSCVASVAIRTGSANKLGIEEDGVQATAAAYEADE
jgi:hypothetical protein